MNTFQKIGLLFSLFIISISWAAEKNWTRLDTKDSINSTTVALSSNGLKIALADKSPGYIYTSSDAGLTWTEQKGSGQRNWSALTFSGDGKLLIAANQNGFIYTSSDAGSTWTEQKGSGQRNWSALVSNNDGTKLFAAEFNGYIYTSTDKGVTWIEQTLSGQRSWRSIAVSANGSKVAAASQNGYIYTSTNYGITWIERTNGGKRSWYSVASSADGNKLIAADFSGYVYTSGNSGSTWSARTAMQRRNWTSVASSADGNKLVAGVDGGLVYISTNSGSTWTALESSLTRRWSFLVSSSDGSMIVGAVIGGGVYALPAPLILSITSSKPDGVYTVGENIPLEFIFSEPLNSAGIIVTLETGSIDRKCSFTLINSAKGTCNYKVQAGDNISLLNINSITGTIRDVASRPLTNYIPLKNLPENNKITIDTSLPSTNPTIPAIPSQTICDSKGLYRTCPLSKAPENSTQYRENMLCEGFIDEEQSQSKRITRIEVLGIAVNMLHGTKSPANEYDNTYTDITKEGNSQATVSIIQTGLDNGLIFPNNGAFEPTKKISRIEAYALLMRGVCMEPEESSDMARAIHQKALQNNITMKQWARFRPHSTITRNEVFILAYQLADWADKNGGCDKLECRK